MNQTIQTEQFILEDQSMVLHPHAGMYWEEENALLITDTHFGKISHFRKNGIAVPYGAVNDNLLRLGDMLTYFEPEKLIILGDLFHSEHNHEWELFQSLIDSFPQVDVFLVIGNHDILDESMYNNSRIHVYDTMEIGPFLLSHHPLNNDSKYNLYGHVHPAVRVRGTGKQSMKIPCFYFCQNYGILPAFGSFTGTATIPVCEEDAVFVLLENKVHRMYG